MKFINENEFKNSHGIYCIINNINNHVYIGQTCQRFVKRYWHHNWKLNDGTHDNQYLQNAWNKYGEQNFSFKVLEVVDENNNEALDELEIKYIKLYRNTNGCYNILDGGDGARGRKLTDEHKRKIGEANRVNMLGKKASEDTKRKMSETRKGKHANRSDYKLTKEQITLIKQMLVSGSKPSDVAKELDVDYKDVNNILSGNTWSDICVDGWEEFQKNRKTWTRLSTEDQVEIYRLYISGGYTQQEIADMYGKTRAAIGKIIQKLRGQKHYMTTQCQAS